jgi:hypothetical protein
MDLSKFVKNKTGRIIMSILLGLGLATLFRQICKGENCTVYKAPIINETDIYKFEKDCYSFEKIPTKCDNKKKTVRFA